MKAAIYTRYGPPEVVQIAETKKPVPKNDEILIRIHAVSVNRTDCGFRSAEYSIIRLFHGLFSPRIKVLGCEFAGVVESAGSDVTQFQTGDKVYGFDDGRWGAHAEFKVIRANKAVVHIPEGISFTKAAALTEGAHYALCDLRASGVGKGTRILINGATGAIGSAAVQLSKHLGASVTAVCHTNYIQLVESLGADRVIDYTAEDFTQCGETFDMVFDAVGKSTFGKCKPLLSPKGIYVSTELGPRSENPFLAIVTPLGRGKRVLFPIPFMKRDDAEYLGQLAAQGIFNPVIDRVYPFSEIVEAYRYVETGMKTGNVVLEVIPS